MQNEFTFVFTRVVHQRIVLPVSADDYDSAMKIAKIRLKMGGDELGTGEKWETTEEGAKIRLDMAETFKANMPTIEKKKIG